ncbi:MAG TPA: hypothetical protein PLL71_07170 [Agriterribacter sp.]|nr:hypothetical protein [Agriterribacter sp.]
MSFLYYFFTFRSFYLCFLQGESQQGAIILDRDYSCADQPDEKYDLLVRFTPVKNHEALASIEKLIILNSSRYLKFDIPSLPNDCTVRVEVIKRKKLTAQDNYQLFNNDLSALTGINKALSAHPGGTLTVNSAQNTGYFNGQMISASELTEEQEYKKDAHFTNFNTNHALNLASKTFDVILYSYHFRTSRYNTLKAKMDAMYYQSVKGYGLEAGIIEMSAVEKFDSYDANGFVSSRHYGGSTVYFSVPLVTFKENSNYNQWLRNYAVPCVYQPFQRAHISVQDARHYTSEMTYQQVQHEGVGCENAYCVPLRPIDIASYDQPLSKNEIEADEVTGYFGGSTLIKDNNKVVGINSNRNFIIH